MLRLTSLQRTGFLRITPRVDLVAAVGLLLLSIALAVSNGAPDKGVTLTVVAVALLWRTRAILGALAGVSIGALLGNLLSGDVVQCGVVLPAVMLMAFAVAARCEARVAQGAGALLLVVTVVQSVGDPLLRFADNAFLVPMVAAMWVAGRLVRSHRQMSLELARRSRELVRRRAERAGVAVELERARVGSELQRVVTAGVGEIVRRARTGRASLPDHPQTSRAEFVAIERSGRRVLNEMRDLLGVLRAPDEELVLAPAPRLEELGELVAAARARGMEVELACHGRARELAPGLDVSAYRIIETALSSAPGSPVSVRVRYGTHDVELEVVSSLPEPNHEETLPDGLLPVRERVALYGGAMHAGVQPDGTFALRARLPIGATRA